ncbi:hypothetical protein Pint_20400 [Pistacia integerrima]|uniref:Uncharacterized protein n=1 Tax=Pistacia integerrima TaxID=434235 RepID=A0ACC0XB35_9ROSI|nr:hypothetical protein Pint_20400 [Pistacia integerrima]
MSVHHLVLLQIILLLWPIKASGAHSCPYHCGDVRIIYPFGIGQGCYFDKGFEVSCDNSSGSPKSFLTSINLVLEDMDYANTATFQVNLPVISLNNKIVYEDFNLSGSHFAFSNTFNTFIAAGCDGYYEQNESTLATCQPFCHCDPTKAHGCCDFICTVPRNYTFDSMATISEVYSASIPPEMECNSAFMVDKEWLQSNYQITNSSVLKGYLICNSTGGYDCSGCPHGYKKDGRECSSPKKFEDIFIKKSRARFFAIIGCSAGLGTLLLVIGVWWLYKFIRKRKAIKLKHKFFKRNGGLLLQQQLSSTEGNIEKTRLFTSKELEKATDNYNANRILGQGGQGTVYKENRLFDILDVRVSKEGENKEIMNVANLTRRCLNLNGKKRPTMREVAIELAGNTRVSGASVVQQNYEEDDFAECETTDHYVTGSSFSTGSFFDGVTLDVDPLISN